MLKMQIDLRKILWSNKFAMCCWIIIFLYIITLLESWQHNYVMVTVQGIEILYLELNCILGTNLFWIYPENSSYYQDQNVSWFLLH